MTEKGKTTNALMKHIREDHKIKINGTKNKKALLSMGYFHGYKACKIIIRKDKKSKDEKLKIDNFEEIKAIYDFDNNIKSILYSPIMKLETTLKNYTIDQVVGKNNPDIDSILATCLANTKDVKKNSDYKDELKRVHKLQSTFHNIIDNTSSPIMEHYLDKRKNTPIWAIFEYITLGDFGNFLLCLNKSKRLDIENMIGIADQASDTNASMISRHVFIIKDLRNAIAHNKVVYDCRFKTMGIKSSVFTQLESKTKINDINFNSIIDYLILIIYYQKHLGETKTQMSRTIKQFRKAIEALKASTKQSTFDAILETNINKKLDNLIKYINLKELDYKN